MPAGLPGSTLAQNLANPSLGKFVIFDPLSGPKGSPLDRDNPGNASTGALSTGIGLSPGRDVNEYFEFSPYPTGYIPGVTLPRGAPPTNAPDSRLMYIGGGRSFPTGLPNPYTPQMVAIAGAGNGGSRDGGAGPAFTGFNLRWSINTGLVDTPAGSVIDGTWVNRNGDVLPALYLGFGSNNVANPAVV